MMHCRQVLGVVPVVKTLMTWTVMSLRRSLMMVLIPMMSCSHVSLVIFISVSKQWFEATDIWH